MNSRKKHVAIIGAGPGGLAAAMQLAHHGYAVEVFEQADRVGGRNAALTLEGTAGKYTFDTGPTFLIMKQVLDAVFARVGRDSSEYLNFTALDPLYRLHFADTVLDVTTHHEEMAERLGKLFPGQENGYKQYLQVEAKRFEMMLPILLQEFSSWKSYMRPNLLKSLPLVPSLQQSVDHQLKKYFSNEELQVAFAFQSKYLGMSSWTAPSIFTSLSYMEHAYGLHHVEGGLNQISAVMANVVEEEGGQIHLNTPVQKVLVENNAAMGVLLQDGTVQQFDDVIVNADFAYAAKQLFEEGALPSYPKRWVNSRKQSCSTIMLYLGLDTQYSELPHHNLYLARDYKANSKAILENGEVPDDNMLFYVHNPSQLDATLAPEGHSALYVLVPVPNTKADINWQEEKEKMLETIFKQLEERAGLTDIKQHIVAERIITPADWASEFNVEFGALFSFAHSMDQMLHKRPHNKLSDIDHCYLVGGGTHPGSGLPSIYASALISTNLLRNSYGESVTPISINL